NGANWWQYYMASKGYLAFTMDNRGTSNGGHDFESSVHRQLGSPETADQRKGIGYLKSWPYVDHERIGDHGWSYGDFSTLNVMVRKPEVFQAGVGVVVVVVRNMYEVMCGETYMVFPKEYTERNNASNMLNHVCNLQGKLILIHGLHVNVVVMQHSMK